MSCLHQCLLHTPCTFCSYTFYTLCTISLWCNLPLACISAPVLCLLAHTWICPTTTNPISSLFNILIVPILLVHAIFSMPLHAHTAPNLLHISSAFYDHHNSSTSLVIPATRSTTLGVLLRILSLSGSWDFSSSLAQSSLCLLFQLQASTLIHLSIPLTIVLLH